MNSVLNIFLLISFTFLSSLTVFSQVTRSCSDLFKQTQVSNHEQTLDLISGKNLTYIKPHVGLTEIRSIEDFAIARYGKDVGLNAVEYLKSKNLQNLIVDAGVVLHLEQFKTFLDHNQKNDNVWAIRQNFSNYLGTRTVYRGMALTGAELDYIQKNGILSGAKRNKKIFNLEVENIKWSLAHHMAGGNRESEFISVTDYATLAIAVGKKFLEYKSNRNLYLFELKIPKLDLVHSESIYKYVDHGATIRINLIKKLLDAHLESFALTQIPSDQIVKITQISKFRQLLSEYQFVEKDETFFQGLSEAFRNLFN